MGRRNTPETATLAFEMTDRTRQGVRVTSSARRTFLFLANGQLFVRGNDGEIYEADDWERSRAAFLLAAQLDGLLDPILGLDVSRSTDS
jgi:hypothetical protein